MRFHARVIDTQRLTLLVASLIKMNKRATLCFSPKEVQLVMSRTVSDAFQIWTGIKTHVLLDEVRLDTIQENNTIAMEVSLDLLLKALKSAYHASDVFLRLLKRFDRTYLQISIEVKNQKRMKLTQDVPVSILRVAEVQALVEPHLPDPEVFVSLPDSRKLCSIVDGLKTLHSKLRIKISSKGELTLTIETETASCATFYTGLQRPLLEPAGGEVERSEDVREVEETVDIRLFYKIIHSFVHSPRNILLCIVREVAVILHVVLDDMYMTYYLPIVLNS